MRVFGNRVPRRIFGPKRDKVTGEWIKLHNGGLMICTPHPIFSCDQLEKNELGRECSTYG
jgi:hypothetical protein